MIFGTKFQLKNFCEIFFGKFGVAKLPLKVIFMIGGFFLFPIVAPTRVNTNRPFTSV